MGLAQTGLPVEEQGVVALPRVLGHRQGRVVGEAVGGAHNKAVEGILLAAHEDVLIGGGLRSGGGAVSAGLLRAQDRHVNVRGEQILQDLHDIGAEALVDHLRLKVRGAGEDQLVQLEVQGLQFAEPGFESDIGELFLQDRCDAQPNFVGRIHKQKTSFQSRLFGEKAGRKKV